MEDYTQEELKQLVENLEAERKESEMISDKCKCIAEQLRKNSCTITPLWHHQKADIDFSKQREPAHPDLIDGYTIIPDVDIKQLISKFCDAAQEIYSDPEFLTDNGFEDYLMCSVVHHWYYHTPLIPPNIIIHPHENKPFAQDGKHRIKAALHLGATHIPILVADRHLSSIKTQLGLP